MSSGSQRYFPRRRAASIRRPVRASGEAGRAAQVAAHRARVQHLDPGDGRAEHVALEAGADDLDLGELGHGRAGQSEMVLDSAADSGGRVDGRVGDAEAGGDLAVRRLGGGLLGLLLGAAHAVAVEALADPDLGGEGLHVVGAVVLDDVLGDAEAVLGGQLLQGGLPVQAGAQRGRGLDERVEQQVDDVGRRLEAAAEVHRTDHRLDGVGEDRGLSAAAGRLLAAAELDVVTDTDVPADHGQRAGVDHGGPELGQSTLGQVRVGAVERLGHDDAEHRVAQELQALVGRQSAVLVGVRAVREGALEELGLQDRIPERGTQLGVVGQRTGTVRGPDGGRRERRTDHTRRTHGAAGAWHRRRGSRRWSASGRRPSRPNDGAGCCCATSSASGQPLFSPQTQTGMSGRTCRTTRMLRDPAGAR